MSLPTRAQSTQAPSARAKRSALPGFSLPVVLGLSALLAVAVGTMMSAVVSAGKTGGDMLRRRKAFYACDGLSRVVVKMSQAYMASTAEPTSAGLEQFICSEAGGCPALSTISPTGFDVVDFNVVTVGESQASTPLPSGPFRGMNARQDTIRMRVEARHTQSSYVCKNEQEITLGKIALFQFYVFSDTYFDGHPGPLMTLNGRAHINGNACPGGNMRIERITASGALRHLGNGNCEYGGNSGPTKIKRADGSYSSITSSNDHDKADWKNYALTEWGGHALDEDHDVPELKPPTIGTPRAQRGAHARDAKDEEGGVPKASESNDGSLRFLIDPVHGGDATDVREQKLAAKADIRILDGTWYIDDGGDWPGTPIWSDHPGRGTQANSAMGTGNSTLGGNQIGQATLNGSLGWTAVPKRFSYYGTRADSGAASDQARLDAARAQYDAANPAPPAVISYGTVTRRTSSAPFSSTYPSASNGIWEPASWLGAELCERRYDASGNVTTSAVNASVGGGSYTTPAAWNGSAAFASYRSAPNCSAGTTVSGTAQIATGTLLLNGARSGFRENHRGGPYSSMADTGWRSQVLPANFDLMAFQEAMKDTTPGELGSYFGGGVDFNGIVWIGYTWPGSLSGQMSDGMADVTAMDRQGTSTSSYSVSAGQEVEMRTDFPVSGTKTPGKFASVGSQPVPPVRIATASSSSYEVIQNDRAATQRELPFPLCTYDAAVTNRSFMTGNPIAATELTSTGDFIVPSCSLYTGSQGGRITAVRVMNGRNLDRELFPQGLTVATNLPIFVLGDMNTDSVPADGAVLPQDAGSRSWVPLLLAGDAMYHVSNNWNDFRSPWSVRTWYSRRQATETTFNIAELIGWVASKNGVGGTRFHNLQGFQERWAGVNHNINGAVTIGWHSVYYRNNRTSGGRWAYSPPYRNWTFDENFRLFSNQPPGTPTFDVSATKRFKRDAID